MTTPLTHRQREVLDFIKDFRTTHGYAPTLREIGAHLGISSANGANEHVNVLARKGYITRKGHSGRTILLVGEVTKEDHLNRVADELADGELAQRQRAEAAEHQLATLAGHVRDDDLVAARNYLTEIGFGVEVSCG